MTDRDAPARRLTLPLPRRYDFDETLRFVHAGPGDPTVRPRRGRWAKATRTPEGPATILIERTSPTEAEVSIWGTGAGWLAPRAAALLGLDDEPPAFAPHDPIAPLARRWNRVRLSRAPWPVETLAAYILQQRVTFLDAVASHRHLTRRFGAPAPGPERLLLPPEPAVLLKLPEFEWRRAGVDVQRMAALRQLYRYAHRIAETADMTREDARKRIAALHGVGPWTLEMTMGFGFADPDAVPIGDYNLPDIVAWMLAGEPRGSDERMLQLLEPYRGQRFRILRWLYAAGVGAPKFGPRAPRA